MNGWTLKSVSVLATGVLAMAVGACGDSGSRVILEPKAVWSADEENFAGIVTPMDLGYRVDFGVGAIGTKTSLTLYVRNDGNAPMTVPSIANLGAGFETDIPLSGILVNIAETRTIQVSFKPTEKVSYEWNGEVSVTDYSSQNLPLQLVGVGQPPAFTCDATELDFGRVLKGRTSTRSVTCTNNSQVDGVLVVSPITSASSQKTLFGHRITADNGRLALGPDQSHEIDVTYRADVIGNAIANLEILAETAGGPARVVNIRLAGVAVGHAIACTPSAPSTLDFGFVAPGKEKALEITCVNQVSEPFEITNVGLAAPDGPYSWEPTATPIVIPAFADGHPGENGITVTFGPTEYDRNSRKAVTLVLDTNDEMTSRIDVPLTGFAGGPVISCTPAVVNFGQVAKDVPATRTVTCSNTGSDDPTRTDDALVVIGLESTNPAEFTAVVRGGPSPSGYAVGEYFTFDVTYNPIDDGVDNHQIRIISNDTVKPPPEDPYAVSVVGSGRDLPPCDFTIIPSNGLRFGIVDKGDSQTQEFAIRNNSADVACMVQNVRLASTCSSVFSLPGGEVELDILPANGELRYSVQFAPAEYRSTPYTCDVLFDISNPDNPHQVVPIRGASQLPCALISPNYLDFGTVKPKCSSRIREFEVLNTCSAPLIIEDIEIGGDIDGEFFVVAKPPKNHSVASGASVTFTMAYRPKNEGVDLGSVFVRTGNTSEPYMASLRGRAANDATQTDAFSQDERPKVDLLWVIDNSGSMTEEQPAIANNLSAFLKYAVAQEIDFHVAVTTTAVGGSSDENGRFFPVDGVSRGIPRIISRNTPNAQDAWANNIKVGTNGNATEKPLQAAHLALTRPLIDSCEADGNCGFLRGDAHLSIIFVTDEPDSSSDTVNYYLTAFKNVKGFRNPHLLSIHAIAGDKGTGCNGLGGSASAAPRVIALVEATNGLFQSICNSDWKETMEKMATAAFGFKTCFFLGNQPEDANGDGKISDSNGELTVLSNGLPKASIGLQGQEVWAYDAIQNAVCFGPFTVPEPGTKIEVAYRVACLDP